MTVYVRLKVTCFKNEANKQPDKPYFYVIITNNIENIKDNEVNLNTAKYWYIPSRIITDDLTYIINNNDKYIPRFTKNSHDNIKNLNQNYDDYNGDDDVDDDDDDVDDDDDDVDDDDVDVDGDDGDDDSEYDYEDNIPKYMYYHIQRILDSIKQISIEHANCDPKIYHCGCGCSELHKGLDGYCIQYPENSIKFVCDN